MLQTLCDAIVNRALNDICPVYSKETDTLKKAEKLKKRLPEIEKKLDEEWESLEREVVQELSSAKSKEDRLKVLEIYKLKEYTFNDLALEKDKCRLAINWFEDDFEKVDSLCQFSSISVKDCYREVIKRLNLVGKKSPVIEDIFNGIVE